jgi:OmpA-OmpF porin, OOP family
LAEKRTTGSFPNSARAVLGFLSQRGVAPTRVEAAGYGDSRPIVPNDSEANRAKNRRIEFRVLTH